MTYDIVLCDYSMPEMTGAEFFGRARNLAPSTARVLVTGIRDFAALADSVNRGGISRVVAKPFDGAQLARVVGEMSLRRPQHTDFPSVLIVDDSETCIEVAREALEVAGYVVYSLQDPFGLAEAVRRHAPAIVLLDVNMPALDGDRLLRATARMDILARTKVVLYSSLPDDVLAAHVRLSGAHGYIRKSSQTRDLVDRVRKVLAHSAR